MASLATQQVVALVIISWALCLDVSAFLLKTCPASPPCVCDHQLLNCKAMLQPSVPIFSPSPGNQISTLDLSINNIANLPTASFANLNLTILNLDYNKISSIDENAFLGLEGTLKKLTLQHNLLKTLPPALGRLRALAWLDVSHNPINGAARHGAEGFTQSVLRSLGSSLAYFKFGHPFLLTQWPSSLYHLQQIQDLNVAGAAIYVLPQKAFHGFEHTLKNLTIEHSPMGQLPLAIATLTVLRELHIDNMPSPFGDQALIKHPFEAINRTLQTLTLRSDQLTVFPEVIKALGHLQSLSLEGNNLQFISDKAIEVIEIAGITTLNLKNCNLVRIPGAISDLRRLLHLDLSENNIRTIENSDLQNLVNLRTLSLAGNPLKYISRSSFFHLNYLEYLDLSNTSLTVISEAIQNLGGLAELNLKQTAIDCTCDLFWIKKWMELYDRNVTIYGDCETIYSKIQTYITNRIPSCPEYMELR